MVDVSELVEEMLEEMLAKYGDEAMAQVAEKMAGDPELLERTIVEIVARHSKVTEFRNDARSILYVTPVTLRDVEAVGIELNSDFGINDAEHEELLDDPDILRIVWGAALNPGEDGWSVDDYHALDTYCAHLDGQGARWENAMRAYYSAQGHRDRQNALINYRKLEELTARLVGEDYERLLAEARKPFEDWLAEIVEDGDAPAG